MATAPDEDNGHENPLIADFILYRGLRRGGELSESMLRAFGAVCVTAKWPVYVVMQPYTIEVHVAEGSIDAFLADFYDVLSRTKWSEGRRIHAVFKKYRLRSLDGERLPWQN